MRALENVFAQTMPADLGYDYLGMSFQEKRAQQGAPPVLIFGFSLLFVFLILAALYESWSLPVSVLLSTPIAVFGTLGLLYLRRTVATAFLPPILVQTENNVYAQIGLVMIIGLVAKNAILIVEFAEAGKEKRKHLGGRRFGWCKASLPADLDDVARFHCRLRAARFRFGIRSGRPSSDGDSRDRWNARHLSDRKLLYSSGFLRGGRAGRLGPQAHQASLAEQERKRERNRSHEGELAEPGCPLSSLTAQFWP